MNINLLREFALTEFKLKYHGSILGYFWSLLNPLLIFGTLYIIFSIFVRFQQPYYHLYLLLGVIIWGYFAESTTNAMTSIYYKSSIIKKIYFPRYIIVLASNIATFIGFILNILVFFIFLFISGIKLSLSAPLFILILPLIFLVSYGTSLLLSSIYLKFLDILHIWRVLLQIGFWLTPIIYPISIVPERYLPLLFINPIAAIIDASRSALIYSTSISALTIIISLTSAIIIFVIGLAVFKKLEAYFAEWV